MGILLGYWIITLFGISISGAHFNPAITVAVMLKKDSQFGTRRLKGLLYMGAQLVGGVLAALLGALLKEDFVEPLEVVSVIVEDDGASYKQFAGSISEATGAFVLIFLFMLCSDKKTQFSNDKVVNCFILAASYCSARLMAGGNLVTAL